MREVDREVGKLKGPAKQHRIKRNAKRGALTEARRKNKGHTKKELRRG